MITNPIVGQRVRIDAPVSFQNWTGIISRVASHNETVDVRFNSGAVHWFYLRELSYMSNEELTAKDQEFARQQHALKYL